MTSYTIAKTSDGIAKIVPNNFRDDNGTLHTNLGTGFGSSPSVFLLPDGLSILLLPGSVGAFLLEEGIEYTGIFTQTIKPITGRVFVVQGSGRFII